MTKYDNIKTVVKTKYRNNEEFKMKVVLCQGSFRSPLLFVAIVEALTCEAREGLLWELLYVDDLVLGEGG